MEAKSEKNITTEPKYVLPKIKDFIKNNKIAKAIEKCDKKDFFTLLRDEEIVNIPFDVYSSLFIYGMQSSGKSTFIKDVLVNILLKSTPDESKVIIIDTRLLEYNKFEGIPYLMCPIVKDSKKAISVLEKIMYEIDHRYDLFGEKRVKNIASYNELIRKKNKENGVEENDGLIPNIYVFIDELTDLLMYSKNEITDELIRILQLSRPTGVYIIATIKSLKKAIIDTSLISMFPNRISFRAESSRDATYLMNKSGAEELDMYEYECILNTAENRYDGKYQAISFDDTELEKLIEYSISQMKAQYDKRFFNIDHKEEVKIDEIDDEYDDPMYDEIVEFVVKTGKVSAALLQRRFKLGYNRSARVIDLLEERGVIGPMNGSKPREVLIKRNNNDSDDGLFDEFQSEIEISNNQSEKSSSQTFENKIFPWILLIAFFVTIIIVLLNR